MRRAQLGRSIARAPGERALLGQHGAEQDPRDIIRALQRREVAGAWQRDPLNIR
jgi:hypothetical protein